MDYDSGKIRFAACVNNSVSDVVDEIITTTVTSAGSSLLPAALWHACVRPKKKVLTTDKIRQALSE